MYWLNKEKVVIEQSFWSFDKAVYLPHDNEAMQ